MVEYREEVCPSCGEVHLAHPDAPRFWNCRKCGAANETKPDGTVVRSI